ncbi:F-box/kelch-repeat protein At1g57790-like [Papaver somniferum]|uniref:F-box/kelch-repeat protein At1g57790-like n=1 Tax=Papaver somniferum TaxID=3469 RepID=UPI000E702E3A|nr:F-box/kelch-repeat protein At1g57790-like [Papaver somniferum]
MSVGYPSRGNGGVYSKLSSSIGLHPFSCSLSNRAIIPMEKVRSSSTSRSTHISPWLMFSRDHSRTTFNFINPMHENENYLMNHSDLVGATVRFQKGGWLLMSVPSQETLSFFYNPFTREAIKLPELPFDYSFSGISFSSLPTSLDCVVFSIEAKGGDEVAVCFIRKGEAFWSEYVFPNTDRDKYFPLLNTPVFCKGVFYCLDYNGTLGVFNIEDNSWKVLEKPHPQFSAVYPNFLVECGGELLSVKLGRHETLFGVFKLDFSKMDWVRVENLGKYMLFISYISCFSAIAPNSRMSNRIYFPRLCLNGDGVLVYSLETGNYQSSGEQHSAINFYDTEGWFSNCTYIEPNWLKSKPQELDWVQPPS